MAYQKFRLSMQSPWNLGTATTHEWSCLFHCSGAASVPTADQEATALGLFAPIKRLISPASSLIRWDHYPAGSTVADNSMTYAPGTKPGDASAYVGSAPKQQLEVCNLCRCPVGHNSKGREVYLRKWVHDSRASISDPNSTGATLNPASIILAEWITGAGPASIVPVDPTSGVQGGPWSIETHLFTHQLRRGSKRKPPAVAGNSIDIPPVPLAAA